jgi:hypothetical protein
MTTPNTQAKSATKPQQELMMHPTGSSGCSSRVQAGACAHHQKQVAESKVKQ